jgi:hypothetical protein
MSLLSVSTISNPSAGSPNILLNADGSVTLPVVSGAAPAQFQAGTLWFDTAGPTLNIRNAANTGWLPVGGGGGGTVTGVTGTLPIVSTGGAAPVLSINAATTSLPGSVQLADGTASKAGTSATLVNTPAFSVPKDASGMTGAALLPTGTTLQQPATPVAGMLRGNTDYPTDTIEAYDGVTASWRPLQYGANLGVLPNLVISTNGPLPTSGTYENITINTGVTATVAGLSQLYARTSITINGTINADLTGYPGPGGASTGFLGNAFGQGVGGGNSNGGGAAYGYRVLLASSGASGQISGDGSNIAGGNGGNAGGSIILQCGGNITVGPAAIITAKGGNGANFSSGNSSMGGCGGAAGGLVVIEAGGTLTLSAGSTINVSGGNGSNGSKSGSGIQVGGGGGGGGGYIVLNSAVLSDSSTKTLTGGTAGSSTGVLGGSGNGGGGGGYGGSGGTGGQPSGGSAPQAGSVGQTLINNYL